MKRLSIKDKGFIKALVTVAIPITIQNFFSTSLNFVDNIMIGRLGKEAIAAVGQANKLFFLFILILFGVYSGSGVFSAQFWGKKDIPNIKRVLGLSLILGGAVSIIFSLAAILIPKTIMIMFSKDLEVIKLGTEYLRLIGISYLLTSVTFAYGMSARSVGLTQIPMYASVISLIINTVLNYTFIFGKFGFEEMGVKGAAIATLIARCIELFVILYLVYKYNGGTIIAAKFNELFDFTLEFVGKILKTALPVIFNEFFWSLGMTFYAVIYGRISTEAVNSVEISNTILNLFMIIGRSIASASAVMIGNKIGDNNVEEANIYARRLCKLGVYVGLIMGVILIITAPLFVNLFNVEQAIKKDVITILVVLGFISFIKILNGILVVGVFRSGGETVFAMALDSGTVWFIGIPMAIIGGICLKLPIPIVIALVNIEEVVKVVIGMKRMLSNKWIKNIVDEM
ncbi:MATE family efflux transporter [Oceanirhabdus sp. W0125-5]|uniref:MATE family efflux transporter n=1 Tax=Oceanirhabdus sp. W0125-5 TaxID=2999116 RepID=UPI0022F3137E|nr:MATE family efflux transporter [Oceanirhabdus sp. W0125-5]WBW99659.1 MATE family efflux transporter [Oceanirhabdus sp. W0125-5]